MPGPVVGFPDENKSNIQTTLEETQTPEVLLLQFYRETDHTSAKRCSL